MHAELLLKVTINGGKKKTTCNNGSCSQVVKCSDYYSTGHGFESQNYKFFPGKPLAAIVIPPLIVYMELLPAIYYRHFSFLDTCFAGNMNFDIIIAENTFTGNFGTIIGGYLMSSKPKFGVVYIQYHQEKPEFDNFGKKKSE